MFFICHTNLVDRFQLLFGDTFTYEGGRAPLFSIGSPSATNIPIENFERVCPSH